MSYREEYRDGHEAGYKDGLACTDRLCPPEGISEQLPPDDGQPEVYQASYQAGYKRGYQTGSSWDERYGTWEGRRVPGIRRGIE